MPPSTPGLHHATATASDPDRNLAFYAETLGLRLVKRTVALDGERTYRLIYGDRTGSLGTCVEFVCRPGARPGRAGTGQATTTRLLIPPDAADYWLDRLDARGVDRDEPVERFGETAIPFRGPDGLELELVAPPVAPGGDPWDGAVPAGAAVRGLSGVALAVPPAGADATAELIEELGYERVATAGRRRRYEAGAAIGGALDLLVDGDLPRGRPGTGTVRRVAFRMPDEDALRAWRDGLRQYQFCPTDLLDRTWFASVRFRERNGIRVELATEGPGYAVDGDLGSLGERLALPGSLEPERAEIEARLPDLDVPDAAVAGGDAG